MFRRIAASVPGPTVLRRSILTLAALLAATLIVITPRLRDVQMERQGVIEALPNLEILTSGSASPVTVRFAMQVNRMTSRRFHVTTVGCLEQFAVNGMHIELPLKCSGGATRWMTQNLDLTSGLRDGWNNMEAIVTDSGKIGQQVQLRFSLLPSVFRDPGFIFVRFLFLILLSLVVIFIVRRWITEDPWLLLIVMAGVILRWEYAFGTDIEIRSHDWWGHLEYLRALSKAWHLPAAGAGWEFQQPPLYYAIGAVIMRLGTLLDWPQGFSEFWVQKNSILLSVATLLLALWIGTILLKKEKWMQRIFVGIVATLPGFVAVSSQISNDALVTPLLFLACGLLLLWWKRPTWKLWIAIWITSAFAFLTKANGMTVLPVVLLCVALHPMLRAKKKVILSLAGLSIFAVGTSWMIAARVQATPEDVRHFLSVGIPGFQENVRVHYATSDFLTFNPVEIWKRPFIVSFREELERKKFLEYFFRSAIFSNLRTQGPLFALPIVAYSLLLLPWMIWGLLSEVRRKNRDALPFHLFSLSVLCAAIALLLVTRFISNQHFRYSTLLGLTGAYFIVRGMQQSPPVLRMAGMVIIAFLCTLMSAFILVQ